jgi:hypothetical protein
MKTRNHLPRAFTMAGFALAGLAMIGLAMTGLLLIPGCATPPKWLEGKWEGMGDQVGRQQPWKIVLDASDLRHVLINYPDLRCGGTWHLMRKSQDTPRLKEHITYGLDSCSQDCEMILERQDDGRIRVTYYLLSHSPDPTATGVVSRVE